MYCLFCGEDMTTKTPTEIAKHMLDEHAFNILTDIPFAEEDVVVK